MAKKSAAANHLANCVTCLRLELAPQMVGDLDLAITRAKDEAYHNGRASLAQELRQWSDSMSGLQVYHATLLMKLVELEGK